MIAMRRPYPPDQPSLATLLMVFWPFHELAALQGRPAPISSALDEPEDLGESER